MVSVDVGDCSAKGWVGSRHGVTDVETDTDPHHAFFLNPCLTTQGNSVTSTLAQPTYERNFLTH